LKQSPSYIHFRSQWQILGPESPSQDFSKEDFLELMKKLNAPPVKADFCDFSFKEDSCEMARVRDESKFSKLTYKNGHITLTEEWAEISINEFESKSLYVLKAWFELFPLTIAVIQRCCFRAFIQPINSPDSRVFLGDNMLGIGPNMKQAFQEMPYKVGFTVTCQRQKDNSIIDIETKVNSWKDKEDVWIEINGGTPLVEPLNAANCEKSAFLIQYCKDFFEREIISLLNQFDQPEKDDTGDGEKK